MEQGIKTIPDSAMSGENSVKSIPGRIVTGENNGHQIYEIKLSGCTAQPFISYFKALGVLRLLSEQLWKKRQKETPGLPPVKGYWKDRVFHLKSPFTEKEIIEFFVNEYEPTPIVSPWNKGSGFYEEKKNSKKSTGLNSIIDLKLEMTTSIQTLNRFEQYRQIIIQISKWLKIESINKETVAEKSAKGKACRKKIVMYCRNNISNEGSLNWFDTARPVGVEDLLSPPPILIKGGSDRNLELSAVFMRCLSRIFIKQNDQNVTRNLIENALFNTQTTFFDDESVGYLNPGKAGGVNQSCGFETEMNAINSFEFILGLEGMLIWSSAVSKRNVNSGNPTTSSPFSVRVNSVGYSSSSLSDEQKAKSEVWTPIWHNLTTLRELEALIKEGRSEIKASQKKNIVYSESNDLVLDKTCRKRVEAKNALEFSEAIASLGVDRGISSFCRNIILDRFGQMHLTIPEFIEVKERKSTDLVAEARELAENLKDKLKKVVFKKRKQVPSIYLTTINELESLIYQANTTDVKGVLVEIIAKIGKIQKLLLRLGHEKTEGVFLLDGSLSPQWIRSAYKDSSNDNLLELKIASSLASIIKHQKVGPMKATITPFYHEQWKKQYRWTGKDIYERLTNSLQKRIMDSSRFGQEYNPLFSHITLEIKDVMDFIQDSIDNELLENLLFGFTLVGWNREPKSFYYDLCNDWRGNDTNDYYVLREYAIIKHLFLPLLKSLKKKTITIKHEQSIIPLLKAGRLRDACDIAIRRLLIEGFNPVRPAFFDDNFIEYSSKLTASLFIPISKDAENEIGDKIFIKQEKRE